MPKRMLLLTDEEIELVLAWAEMVHDDVLHDFEDDDQAVYDALQAARLKA